MGRGEGDRTRDGWVEGHRAFFRRWFAATGKPADEDPELLFERFELVWPPTTGGPGGGATRDQAAERTTPRLLLRRWTDADRPAFAAMNADPAVMEHLAGVLDRAASDALLDAIQRPWAEHGVGLWAVERREDGRLLGWAGLNPMPAGVPAAGEWEIGWRLAREAWGHGYATEAAREGLQVARERGEPRVWSMTVPANVRSVAVMRRLGLTFDRTFEHPRFPPGHRLCEHVLYRLDLARP